ncbi:DUF3077 domain-containing protein [Pseudomonas yamanorum]|jgi:hypothetical protein|uniref:DUF3077 domain-containing protein n=1 Tax=Pseudomonas yamanorum TaxID=515393 RepID=A0A7Y8F9N3_9PSED|nr:DUF3077 domain-containing protein [Pseudomonas yamanorum]NVZ81110.1 DUF3077 domain-containing protein [Pseudomonas yamanorum]NWE12835.1 DUF3077 domain-containing protein [Pseudomonas yamanorum]NWE39206.1 DUF3077 domain-containing protein [Pseudomonas yamanorum]NWE75045.1 DUF3077 domain-containing protein [Pseudomonas yamanorum]
MDKIVPDPPFSSSDSFSDQSQKHAAYKRALDHYLNPNPSPTTEEPMLFTVDPDTSFESALVHTSSLLHCASVTAQQAGDQLDGASRALVISVLHLVDMARVMVDRAVDCMQPR